MNFMLNRWGYGTMAAVAGIVMAYAMSERYEQGLIFYIGAPAAVILTVVLTLVARRAERNAIEGESPSSGRRGK